MAEPEQHQYPAKQIIRFQQKNLPFLSKNLRFILKNLHFPLKNQHLMCKTDRVALCVLYPADVT